MIRLLSYTILAAVLGAGVVYLLAEGLPEGAIAGAVIGASLGVIVAARKGAGDSAASFEYEAAGLHDNNLTTIARRNLVARGISRQLQSAGSRNAPARASVSRSEGETLTAQSLASSP